MVVSGVKILFLCPLLSLLSLPLGVNEDFFLKEQKELFVTFPKTLTYVLLLQFPSIPFLVLLIISNTKRALN
jgi:hypothetical protein